MKRKTAFQDGDAGVTKNDGQPFMRTRSRFRRFGARAAIAAAR